MGKMILTSMLPPTLASRGGRGLSLSFLSPFRLGLRELAADREKEGLIFPDKNRISDLVSVSLAGRKKIMLENMFLFFLHY